jgi:hypothetical protein
LSHQKILLSKVQCSHIVTFINVLGHLLIGRHKQIDYILIDWRRQSSVPDVRLLRAPDFDTDHHLVVAKVKERLAVSK